MKKYFKYSIYEWICLGLLILYFIPLIFSQSVRFLIHDNMDGLLPLYRFMGNPDVFFANRNEIINGLMGELPRSVLPSQFSFFRLLFLWFDSQTAYSLHYIFQHLIAFIGLRILLKEYISKDLPLVYNFVSLSFAMLPFWPGGELTVAGLPILVWAMLAIWNNKAKFINWLIVALFPFFSVLPFGNLFSFPLLFIVYLFGLFASKDWRFKTKDLLPFILLAVFTIISEFEMFNLLFSGFQSNRLEDSGLKVMLNLKGIIGVSVLAFTFGHYHFHTLHLPILIFAFILLTNSIFRKDFYFLKKSISIIGVVFILYFLTIFLNNVVLIRGFNFSIRFWAVFPIIWYAFFAWLLLKVSNPKMILTLTLIQIIWVMFLPVPRDYYGTVYAENVFYYTAIDNNNGEHARINSYYAKGDFDAIKNSHPEILKDNVMCIGFVPAIASFNGFKTYDAYLNLYPIEKWRQIKKINALEFKKSGIDYYSNNRAYLYVSDKSIENGLMKPEWDLKTLHQIGVKYILSNKPIVGPYTIIVKSGQLFVYKILMP